MSSFHGWKIENESTETDEMPQSFKDQVHKSWQNPLTIFPSPGVLKINIKFLPFFPVEKKKSESTRNDYMPSSSRNGIQ